MYLVPSNFCTWLFFLPQSIVGSLQCFPRSRLNLREGKESRDFTLCNSNFDFILYYNLLLCCIQLEMHVRFICAIKFYILTCLGEGMSETWAEQQRERGWGGKRGEFTPSPRSLPTFQPWLPSTSSFVLSDSTLHSPQVGSVAEWLACWTQAQKSRSSNRSRDAVG